MVDVNLFGDTCLCKKTLLYMCVYVSDAFSILYWWVASYDDEKLYINALCYAIALASCDLLDEQVTRMFLIIIMVSPK